MRIEYCGCSQTGAVRPQNEDAILMRSEGDAALFMVADGIGGGVSGEVVSGMLRNRLGDWWGKSAPAKHGKKFMEYLEEIKGVLCQVNRDVVECYGELKAGSTVVLLFLLGDVCAYVSAGDSRIYKTRYLRCCQVTRDDIFENLPQERAARYNDPVPSGKLAGAVGIRAHLDFSVRTDNVRAGDMFFLCSDGVYRYLPFRGIKRRLVVDGRLFSQEHISNQICAEVEKNGAADNYSFILVKVH